VRGSERDKTSGGFYFTIGKDFEMARPQKSGMSIEEIIKRFSIKKTSDNSWQATCPCHDDKKASLTITYKPFQKKTLLYCHAGCKTNDIVRKVGLKMTDLFDDTPTPPPKGKKRITEIYQYTNEKGDPVFQVVRFHPKDFRMRIDENNWKLNGIKRPLYRLHKIVNAQLVLLLEGEKDVHTAESIGLTATTNAGGALKWKSYHSEYLKGKDVIIIPDNDKAGEKDITKKVNSLKGVAKSVRILRLPLHKEKEDFTDWVVKYGGNKEKLTEMIREKAKTPEESVYKGIDNKKITETDEGNGYRFAKMFSGKTVYCHEKGCWFIWNGKYWEKDTQENINILAGQVTDHMIYEESKNYDHARTEKVIKWAFSTKKGNGFAKMLEKARALPIMKKTINEFDSEPSLITFKNGTVNLKTGELSPHNKEDYITNYIDIDYSQSANFESFYDFLFKIMCDRIDLVNFIQVALGYSLTGEVSEECLFFMYGDGSNGKSTLMNIIKWIFGDMYLKLGTESIMQHHITGANSKPYELASLKGKRLALVSEIDTGDKLKESIIKDLTSRDTIQARQIREKPINFEPTHKLWMYGNHKPEIKGTDDGIWRRIKLIPFDYKISPEEKILNFDQKLYEKEKEGILAWICEGARIWYEKGLPESDVISKTTNAYRQEMDSVLEFVKFECEVNPVAQVKASKLFSSYKTFCKINSEFPIGRNDFYSAIREKYDVQQTNGSGNVTIFKGIGIATDDFEGYY